MGPWLVGVAFWLFLTAAAVSGIVADYKKRKLEIEPLRAAIERGQQLDPALIEKLMACEPRGQPLNPQDLRVGGIITIAAAVGIGLLSWSSIAGARDLSGGRATGRDCRRDRAAGSLYRHRPTGRGCADHA